MAAQLSSYDDTQFEDQIARQERERARSCMTWTSALGLGWVRMRPDHSLNLHWAASSVLCTLSVSLQTTGLDRLWV